VLGVPVTEGFARFAILGGVGILLLLVLGLLGYRWYDDNIGKPREVVLRVDNQTFTLGYFTDRLGAFALANRNLTRGFLEPALLTKLEEEAVMEKIARDRGHDLSDEAVTLFIADELGVAPGGSGTPFDTLYRQRLRQTGLSDSDFRRLSRAGLAESLLMEDIREEIGDTGETLRLRVVLVDSEETAAQIIERIEGGEDMGTIAQTESDDLESRQQDGLLPPTPRRLLPENVRSALESAGEGTLLEPVQVQSFWWVIRLETIEPEGTLTPGNKEQLADLALRDLIEETKAGMEIRRSLSDTQVSWAYRNVTLPEGS
jgi:hypothetical protein